MAGLAGNTLHMLVDIGGCMASRQGSFGAVAGGGCTADANSVVSGSQVGTATGNFVVGVGVALLAGQICTGCSHVDVVVAVGCCAVNQSQVATFEGIAAATLGVALEAVGLDRFVNGLHSCIHGDGHLGQVRFKQPGG